LHLIKSIEDAKALEGEEVGLSDWMVIDQQMIDRFAKATEDYAKAVNFGCNKVRFYSPVPVGSKVRGRATVIQARIRGGALHLLSQIKVEIEGVKKPACVAETLGIYFFAEIEQPAAQTA